MPLRPIDLVSVALLAGCASAMAAPTPDDDRLEDELVSLEKQSWVAWQQRDGAFFASFLSDDHVELGAGGPSDKSQVVAFVGSPACKVERYAVDGFRMTRLAADAALLVYHATQDTTCGHVAVPSPAWVSSLFVFRDGRWQNAAYQQSPASK